MGQLTNLSKLQLDDNVLQFQGTTKVGTLLVAAGLAQATTFTIPDPGAATANLLLDTGAQTLKGAQTLNSTLTMTAGLILDFAADALTAHAGGGQASALALTAQINRVTTVSTAADSVKLPASAPGLEIVVINSGANAMQVFGAGTDTINGIATGTGVSQVPNSACLYYCTVAGSWFCNEVSQGFSGAFPTVSTTNGITAHAGGGQGSAVLLTTVINRVTTVGSAGDSVILPVSVAGMQLTVTNAAAANSMNLFPATGEAINALGANAAFAIAAGKTAVLSCALAGQWHAVLSA